MYPLTVAMNAKRTAALLALVLAPLIVQAESAWVTDQFEITLRSGPSTSNEIRLMVRSGTELEVLQRDDENGYTQVPTSGGTEGWVLSRYLMTEPSAREQLTNLTGQLSSATSRGSTLNQQLGAVRSEYDNAQQRIRTLEQEKADLEAELAEIQRTAANVLSINQQNKDLNRQLSDAGIRIDMLEQENRELGSQTNRYWFMSGGLVLVVGMILGLTLFFRRFLSQPGRWLGALSGNVYGVYLVHVYFVIGLQVAILGLAWPALAKFVLVTAGAVVLSFLIVSLLRLIPAVRKVV